MLRDKTMLELVTDYTTLEVAVAKNDGRLSTSSSDQLDYELEQLEEIGYELCNRLQIEKYVRPIVKEELRQRALNRRQNFLLRLLLRVGFISQDLEGEIRWPFSIDPPHMWRYYLFHEPWFGVFRNLPGIVKWLQGRWLPRRWGFRLLMFEFGDRGSSHLPQDSRRISLFK